ncbi:MAG: hypothetical protein Q9160_003231 [Pyrenula sp. 1 TL-2023]
MPMPSTSRLIGSFVVALFHLALQPTNAHVIADRSSGSDSPLNLAQPKFLPRNCKEKSTEFADNCDSLAGRCGISKGDLSKFNPQIDICKLELVPSGLPICCSAGDLSYTLPQNDEAGNCARYLAQDNDTCESIANTFELPMSFIEEVNSAADWGWMGCENLIASQAMCLSNGTGIDESIFLVDGEFDIVENACGSAPYNTLEELDAALSTLPQNCVYQYTLEVLQKLLTDSLNRYDDLMANHYDSKFNTFAKAVVQSAPKQVKDFMQQNGNKCFSCVVTEMQMCCGDCPNVNVDPNGRCRYCYKGKCDMSSKRDSGGPCRMGICPHTVARWMNVSEPCPPDYSMRGLSQGNDLSSTHDTVYWTLQQDKMDQFWADLLTTTGLTQDNVAFQDVHNLAFCNPTDSWEECRRDGWDIGIPAPNGYDTSDVTNPKDIISNGLANLTGLNGQMTDILDDMRNGFFHDSGSDIIDAVALPVTMVMEAIETMESVVETADEIEEEQRKGIILAFLGALLFFIPFVGEVLGSVAGLANLARIVAVLATAGDAAMNIYTIVDDPANAPLAIFGLVLGPLGLANMGNVAKAASLRRGMKAEDVAKMGKNVGPKMDIINKCTGMCFKR